MAVEFSMIESIKDINNFVKDLDFHKFFIEQIRSNSSDMIIILNDKKQILYCSKNFQELFNDENIFMNDFQKQLEEITQLPDDFFEETSYFLSIKRHNKDVVLKAEILKYLDKRYIIILKDITDKKEIQAQNDNFIATLTHDLKTPVRANILSLELLLKNRFGKLNKEQNEIICEILNSNKFMMSMLDTLLAKYKYENGEVELNKTCFYLNEFVKESTLDLKCLFNEKKVKYFFDFCEDIKISGDKIELKRALLNILSNAIKFNKNKGSVNISTFKKDGFIQIQIQDSGIGMSKEKLEHIFDKYVSYAKKLRKLGTGLGLYVAKKIIETHDGKIEVTSTLNEGSTFTILLPEI